MTTLRELAKELGPKAAQKLREQWALNENLAKKRKLRKQNQATAQQIAFEKLEAGGVKTRWEQGENPHQQ